MNDFSSLLITVGKYNQKIFFIDCFIGFLFKLFYIFYNKGDCLRFFIILKRVGFFNNNKEARQNCIEKYGSDLPS